MTTSSHIVIINSAAAAASTDCLMLDCAIPLRLQTTTRIIDLYTTIIIICMQLYSL
jgi:hypothetical protein